MDAPCPPWNQPIPGILTYENLEFKNWGQNCSSKPLYTFVPRTTKDVIEIVKYALLVGKRIRCSGYRHSWSPMNADDGEIQICMIPLSQSDLFPHVPSGWENDELRNISIFKEATESSSTTIVALGAAVSNEQIMKWCVDKELTYLSNVVLVENLVAGTTSMCCHGSGINNQGIADRLFAVEMVCLEKGVVTTRKFDRKNNADIFNSAGAAFGLFGVITKLYWEMEPMTYASMHGQQVLRERGVPRHDTRDTDAQMEFENRIYDNFYNEFFWFPFQKNVYINCWKNDGSKDEVESFPSKATIAFSTLSLLVMNYVNGHEVVSPKLQAEFIGKMSMAMLPQTPVVAHLPDALHFQRGIHGMRCFDMEVEVNLPPRSDNENLPDLTLAQKLWWSAIDLILKKSPAAPATLPLEMRIFKNSKMTMAPQNGNDWTCAIEVLTTTSQSYLDSWLPFCNELLVLWMRDAPTLRPHFAKQWVDLQFGPTDAVTYVQHQYANQIKQFKSDREKAGVDPHNMFSNKLWDAIFGLKKL